MINNNEDTEPQDMPASAVPQQSIRRLAGFVALLVLIAGGFLYAAQVAELLPILSPADGASPTAHSSFLFDSEPVSSETVSPAKRLGNTSALAALSAARTIKEAEAAFQVFANQYQLVVGVTSVPRSSAYGDFTSYDLLDESDLPVLKVYGAIFIDEWSKYPTSWVKVSGLKHLALVKGLYTFSSDRAAMPDPFDEILYYDVEFANQEIYSRQVIHHELNHIIEYNLFGSYEHPDPVWAVLNSPDFTYGDGGASCYLPENTCSTDYHPLPGFVSGYAMSAIEEDKAELYAYLMTGALYQLLQSWMLDDPLLVNKVSLYKQFIASHAPEMSGSYFDDINGFMPTDTLFGDR